MGKANILVVDDLRSIRLTLEGILEDKGHNVITAEDGYQAIEAVKKNHFDAIFMDIKMPGINGVQTFKEVHKIDPKALVIMMTAYSMEDLVKEALEEGAYAIAYKPFDIDRITSIIGESLREKILILVVDDHFTDRETLKLMLEDKGYRVAIARNGVEALQLVREKHHDIIFLNNSLPDMYGVEIFERVKEIDAEVAVVMMTGDAEEDLVKKAVKDGTYTYIHKPCDAELLVALVDIIAEEKT